VQEPQRDLPIGIIATLGHCTILYIAVVGRCSRVWSVGKLVDDAAPVVNTLKKLHFSGVPVCRADRRTHGNDLFLLVFQLGPGARVFCDGARWPLFQNFWARASAVSDT